MIDKEKVPSKWKWVPLGQVCKIIGGKPAPQTDDAFHNKGIPFVRMKDLGAYHLTTNLVNVADRLSKEYVNKKNITLIKKGAILLPRSGSVALNHRAILGVDAVIVSHICALEVISPNVFNVYLYYVLTLINMQNITKKTTGLDAITFEDLSKIEIPLPSLDEQRRIAAIFEDLQANTRRSRMVAGHHNLLAGRNPFRRLGVCALRTYTRTDGKANPNRAIRKTASKRHRIFISERDAMKKHIQGLAMMLDVEVSPELMQNRDASEVQLDTEAFYG